MDSERFHFQLGRFECLIVSDGNIPAPNGVLEIQCLLIQTGINNVIIDTGCGIGNKPNAGRLLRNLQAEGMKTWEIDTVINTHGHGDHISGNTDKEGRVAFSNARYVIHKREWDYWQTELISTRVEDGFHKNMIEQARRNLFPIQDRYDLIEDETEIVPSIKPILAPGHTPGHMAIEISSGTDKLICIGDLIRDPIEFTQPDLYQFSDINHEQAVQTRTQFLSHTAESGNLIFANHLPFPGLGHIKKKGDTLLWKPMKHLSY